MVQERGHALAPVRALQVAADDLRLAAGPGGHAQPAAVLDHVVGHPHAGIAGAIEREGLLLAPGVVVLAAVVGLPFPDAKAGFLVDDPAAHHALGRLALDQAQLVLEDLQVLIQHRARRAIVGDALDAAAVPALLVGGGEHNGSYLTKMRLSLVIQRFLSSSSRLWLGGSNGALIVSA